MKKYAIIYRRISTNSTKQDIDRQKQPIVNYCKSNDLEILNDFFDEISGTTKAATRTGYNKMKDYIDSIIDNYDALQISIVFDEISRLGRSKVDIINVIDEWSKRNVNIRVVNPALSYYDDAGNIDYNADLILTLFAQMAESEHRTIKERIKSSRLRVIEKGHSLGSVELFGYKNNNKVLEIEKEEAELVKTIFDMYVNKNMGTVAITRYLNTQKLKSRRS
ncbi:MAG: recombinase family protein, partial [Bacteroidales bacterium]